MKIQCACGAKYAFEVTPDQARQRVEFVCPACGLDSSDYVTQLARQEFGGPGAAPPVAPPTEIVPTSPMSPPTGQLRLHRSEPKAVEEVAPPGEAEFCPKHPGVGTTANCLVCDKPICPK